MKYFIIIDDETKEIIQNHKFENNSMFESEKNYNERFADSKSYTLHQNVNCARGGFLI